MIRGQSMLRGIVAGFLLFVSGLLCLDPPARAWWQSVQQVSATTSAWSPLTVSAAFWYDASDASTTHNTSGTITTWDDKSGNARNLTQAGGAGQVATLVSNVKNSMPGVLFNVSGTPGSDAAVLATTSPFSVSFPNTVVLALLGGAFFTDPTNATIWMVVSTADQAILLNSSLPSMYAGTAVTAISGSVASNGVAYTYYAQFNGASSRGGVNGVDIGSNINPGSGTITSVNIQFGRTGSGLLFSGYILESFGFPGVNNTNRDNALTYLNTKWGGFP